MFFQEKMEKNFYVQIKISVCFSKQVAEQKNEAKLYKWHLKLFSK